MSGVRTGLAVSCLDLVDALLPRCLTLVGGLLQEVTPAVTTPQLLCPVCCGDPREVALAVSNLCLCAHSVSSRTSSVALQESCELALLHFAKENTEVQRGSIGAHSHLASNSEARHRP